MFLMMPLWNILLLITICDYTLASCKMGPTEVWTKPLYPDSYLGYVTITCRNTSADDYSYEIFQLNHDHEPNVRFVQLEILTSNFSIVEDLNNPITMLNQYEKDAVFSLKINFCQVQTIVEDAFNNFPYMTDLNLGFNKIENLEFIFNLPKSISNLNLTNNKISYINLTLPNVELEYLDLSFNDIAELDISTFKFLPTYFSLDLSSNKINTIKMPLHSIRLDKLNLANNPLKQIKNCQQTAPKNVFIKLLNLSNSLLITSLRNITSCRLTFKDLISSNNKLSLDDLNLDFRPIISLDLSNSSITHIPISLFNTTYGIGITYLNLSHNDLNNLSSPVFSRVHFSILDLSYSNIKDIDIIFQDTSATNINLTGNKILELNLNSFSMVKDVESIDLSFNNLKLNNDSFINCNDLKWLNLANSNISVIEQFAFNGLSSLNVLNLGNNSLKNLNSKIFEPLIRIREIYLQNNQLRTLESNLFSSLPLKKINLNGNMIELIKTKAFHNLDFLKFLQINDNNASLKIENQGFSNLQNLNEIDLSNSRLTDFNLNIFSETPKLKSVNIKGNNCTFIDLRKRNTLNSLQELHLTINGDLKPKSFLGLNFLLNLTIWDSKIDTLPNRAFQGLFNLQALHLKNSEVNTIENGALDGLFRLQFLDVENLFNNTRSIDEMIFHDLHTLPTLNLSYQKLEVIRPFAFKGLNNIENLYLSSNNLSSFEENTFFGLKSLTFLDLSYNIITFIGRNYFIGLEGLKTLNVSNNHIDDLELGAFQHFPHLENLILKGNNLTSFNVGIFSNLYDLKTLDLSQNSISTILLESFLPLRSLGYLNLDLNNLKTFGQFSLIKKLRSLNRIGIAKNKWKCDYLRKMLVKFRDTHIIFSSSYYNFNDDNIEGIDCIDVCKYLLCLKDSHGIN